MFHFYSLPKIWMCLFASMLALTVDFVFINWLNFRSMYVKQKNSKHKMSLIYVVEVLLSQGRYALWFNTFLDSLHAFRPFTGSVCFPQSTSIRLLAGIWCLAACVIVNTFSSTLTAHLLVSYPRPIIKSIYELPEQSAVKLLVKKGSGTDFLFSASSL